MKISEFLGVVTVATSLVYSNQIYSGIQTIPSGIQTKADKRYNQGYNTDNLERTLSIEEQAKELNQSRGYSLTGEDLVLLTRIVYKEAGSDPKAKTPEDLKRGWAAVAEVIVNRYELNKKNKTNLFRAENESLEAIIRAKDQFHPVHENPKVFDPETFYNQQGELQLAYPGMQEKRAQAIYETVISVLEERSRFTNGAVFFHADYVKPGRKAGTTAFHLKEKPCKLEKPTHINTHLFFATTCNK